MAGRERCYCIFEGGGAKGIAHIGALSALEEAEFDLAGFAGTSAGAIIAALAAAGYSSNDLFSPDGSILDRIDRDCSHSFGFEAFDPMVRPERLFGRGGWAAIRLFRFFHSFWLPVLAAGLAAAFCLLWLLMLGGLAAAALMAGFFLSLLVGLPWLIVRGAANLKVFRRAMNQALSLKLRGDRDTAPVTFRELHEAGCRPLKIVSTDITHQTMAIFSYAATPDVAVADAVAASVCLPGIFAPWLADGALHYDGGLVSNLPAWAFDSERALDRDAWTAVVEVVEEPKESKWGARLTAVAAAVRRVTPPALWETAKAKLRPSSAKTAGPLGFAVLKATMTTALFGAGMLNKRNVDRLRSVTLYVDLKITQFDIDRAKAELVVEKARKACEAELVYRIDLLPRQMEEICEQIVRISRAIINDQRRIENGAKFRGQLRTAILFGDRADPTSLIQEYNAGYYNHSDERLRLPIAGSLAGEAWRDDAVLYSDRSQPSWNRYLARPEDRWARKLTWQRIRWSLCVPYVHEPSGERMIIILDASEAMELSEMDATLELLAEEVESVLEAFLPEEAFAHDSSG